MWSVTLKITIQVPMEKQLLAHLDRRAKSEAVSRAALIRNACARYLREVESAERERRYVEGYRRIPEAGGEQETLAWLAGGGATRRGMARGASKELVRWSEARSGGPGSLHRSAPARSCSCREARRTECGGR